MALEATAGKPLSPREYQVLALLAEGKRLVDVARELGLSVHTVKNQRGSAYTKLGSTSLIEALRKLGWL